MMQVKAPRHGADQKLCPLKKNPSLQSMAHAMHHDMTDTDTIVYIIVFVEFHILYVIITFVVGYCIVN